MDVNKFCEEIASPRIRHFVQNRIIDSSQKKHFVEAYEIITSMFPHCDVYSSRQEEGKETYWHAYFGINPFKNAKDGKGTPCITLTKFKEGVVLWEGGADKSTTNRTPYQGNVAALKQWLNSLDTTKNDQMAGSGHRFNFYHDPYQLEIKGASSGDTNTTVTSPLNQILYGPPGTGKTYHTVQAAVKAAEPLLYAELGINEDKGADNVQREKLIELYKGLYDDKRIRFVTFHQSYGYEEFVEGIKAETDNGNVKYTVEPGVFKKLVESAKEKRIAKNTTEASYELGNRKIWKMSLGNTLTDEGEAIFNECLNNDYILLGYGGELDFTGCKDTTKIKRKFTDAGYTLKPQDYNVTAVNTLVNKMKIGDLVIVSDGNYKFKAIAEITSDYTYLTDDRDGFYQKRNVNWLLTFEEPRPIDELCSFNLSQMTLYNLKDSVISRDKLSSLLNKTRDEIQTVKNYVLIIDEINRGNISKIFGELITLIEPSKRSGLDTFGNENLEALSVNLPHTPNKTFSVPNNIYLIGTMNTADRSLAMMDTALRRRFDFVEMMPDPKKLQGKLVNGIDLEKLLRSLNERIEVLYDREHTLGHAFFMPVVDLRDGNEQKVIVADEKAAFVELQNIFKNKIIPLLEEYFFEDWNKIRLVLGDNQKTTTSSDVNKKLEKYMFVQASTKKYSKIFGYNHGIDDHEDEKTTYKLASFTDENSPWIKEEVYQAIYAQDALKQIIKQAKQMADKETSGGGEPQSDDSAESETKT